MAIYEALYILAHNSWSVTLFCADFMPEQTGTLNMWKNQQKYICIFVLYIMHTGQYDLYELSKTLCDWQTLNTGILTHIVWLQIWAHYLPFTNSKAGVWYKKIVQLQNF